MSIRALRSSLLKTRPGASTVIVENEKGSWLQAGDALGEAIRACAEVAGSTTVFETSANEPGPVQIRPSGNDVSVRCQHDGGNRCPVMLPWG